jgi:hypothetical protein
MSAAQHPPPKNICIRPLGKTRNSTIKLHFHHSVASSPSNMSSAKRVCYTRNGTQITDIAYQPCNSDVSRDSVCCGTNHQGAGHLLVANDACDPNGLCQNFEAFDGTNQGVKNWWRQGCTDPTWQSESCLKDVCNFGKVSLLCGVFGSGSITDEGASGKWTMHRCKSAQMGVGAVAKRVAAVSRRVFSNWRRRLVRVQARHLQLPPVRVRYQLRCRHRHRYRQQEVLFHPPRARHKPRLPTPLHRARDSRPVRKRE